MNTTQSSVAPAAPRDWRDLDGLLIRKPGRLAIELAAYANHLHVTAGGEPDFGGCITSLMSFSKALSHRRLLGGSHATYLLWLVSLVGDSISREELEVATNGWRRIGPTLSGMLTDQLITVAGETISLKDYGRKLADEASTAAG